MLIKFKNLLSKYIICEYKSGKDAKKNLEQYKLDIIAYPETIEIIDKYIIPSTIHCIDRIVSNNNYEVNNINFEVNNINYEVNDKIRFIPILMSNNLITIYTDKPVTITYIRYEFSQKIINKLYNNPVKDDPLYYYNGNVSLQ